MVDKTLIRGKISPQAEVAEQADALRSGRSGNYSRVGSTPTFGILISYGLNDLPAVVLRGFWLYSTLFEGRWHGNCS